MIAWVVVAPNAGYPLNNHCRKLLMLEANLYGFRADVELRLV
jgi:hypothetical protein